MYSDQILLFNVFCFSLTKQQFVFMSELAYYDSAVHRFNHYTIRTKKRWCAWCNGYRRRRWT